MSVHGPRLFVATSVATRVYTHNGENYEERKITLFWFELSVQRSDEEQLMGNYIKGISHVNFVPF